MLLACGTTAMSRARSCGGKRSKSCPLNSTLPLCSGSTPLKARTRVDLPAPFGPMTARISPGCRSKVTCCRTFFVPYPALKSTISSISAPVTGLTAAAQNPEEERRAGQGRDHAHRQFLRRDQHPRQHVSRQQQRSSAHQRQREQPAVVHPGPEAQDMRHEQSNEANDPGEEHGRGGGQRGS